MKKVKRARVSAFSFKRWPWVIIVLSVLAGNGAAASHFHLADSSSGQSMLVFIDTAIHPTINGLPMHNNDEIAVFDSLGICYGWTAWDSTTGGNQSMTVWGYNPVGPNLGMRAGATLHFRLWDTVAGEMSASVTYYPVSGQPAGFPLATATSTYVNLGVSDPSSITGLTVPAAPPLVSPTNGESFTDYESVTVIWATVATATSYTVQVATVKALAALCSLRPA